MSDELRRAVRQRHSAHDPRRSAPLAAAELGAAIRAGYAAADDARAVRGAHRRRHRSDRDEAVCGALARLRAVMRPIRAELARLPSSPGRERQFGPRLRKVSRRIQAERKALTKMKRA